MKKKASAFWGFVTSTPTIVVAIITLGGGGIGWSVNEYSKLVNEKADAQAELKTKEKYDEKYSAILTDYAILRATCEQGKH